MTESILNLSAASQAVINRRFFVAFYALLLFIYFLAQGQLKISFSHLVLYEFAVMDRLSTNSATTAD